MLFLEEGSEGASEAFEDFGDALATAIVAYRTVGCGERKNECVVQGYNAEEDSGGSYCPFPCGGSGELGFQGTGNHNQTTLAEYVGTTVEG